MDKETEKIEADMRKFMQEAPPMVEREIPLDEFDSEVRQNDYFLLSAKDNDTQYIATCRELLWHEMNEIDCQSFTNDNKNYNDIKKQQLVLEKAIIGVYDLSTKKYYTENILKHLTYDFVEQLWEEYLPYTEINNLEAERLFEQSIKYFKREAQDASPVSSIILRVNMWIQFNALNMEAIEKLTYREFEKIQIVLMARSKVLGLEQKNTAIPDLSQAQASQGASPDISKAMLSTFPPSVRKGMTDQ